MSEPILVVQDLHKSYGEKHAVRGVSFQIARGEVFGLLGPNGAGKTTTVSALTGLFSPTSGDITVDGLDLRTHTHAAKAKMGLVPQELALYPSISARDNLAYFGRIYGLRGKRLRERIEAALELVGLADRGKDRVDTYSGGMKRRLNIAAGLLHEPEVLFLDEPTVGVDPQSRNAIFEGVEALNRAGLTIIYTTHYMEEAQRLCHRVAIIDEGQIVALDTPTGLIRGLGGGIIQMGLGNGKVEAVAAKAVQLAAIKDISHRDGMLQIEVHRAQEALTGVLEITNHLGVCLTSLNILEPNLETVFLHMTGKSLRD